MEALLKYGYTGVRQGLQGFYASEKEGRRGLYTLRRARRICDPGQKTLWNDPYLE